MSHKTAVRYAWLMLQSSHIVLLPLMNPAFAEMLRWFSFLPHGWLTIALLFKVLVFFLISWLLVSYLFTFATMALRFHPQKAVLTEVFRTFFFRIRETLLPVSIGLDSPRASALMRNPAQALRKSAFCLRRYALAFWLFLAISIWNPCLHPI